MAKQTVKFVTPVGVAVYPKLDKPGKPFDANSTPKYEININFGDQTWAVKAKMEKDIKEAGFKGKKRPWKELKDGTEVFVAKTVRKPMVFDAQNQPVPESVVVGGGSKVRAAIALSEYTGGVNAFLNSVQVISLVEKGSSTSPFEATEGFQYFGAEKEETASEKTPFEASDDDEDEDIGF